MIAEFYGCVCLRGRSNPRLTHPTVQSRLHENSEASNRGCDATWWASVQRNCWAAKAALARQVKLRQDQRAAAFPVLAYQGDHSRVDSGFSATCERK